MPFTTTTLRQSLHYSGKKKSKFPPRKRSRFPQMIKIQNVLGPIYNTLVQKKLSHIDRKKWFCMFRGGNLVFVSTVFSLGVYCTAWNMLIVLDMSAAFEKMLVNVQFSVLTMVLHNVRHLRKRFHASCAIRYSWEKTLFIRQKCCSLLAYITISISHSWSNKDHLKFPACSPGFIMFIQHYKFLVLIDLSSHHWSIYISYVSVCLSVPAAPATTVGPRTLIFVQGQVRLLWFFSLKNCLGPFFCTYP